jgi:hypothetical protein
MLGITLLGPREIAKCLGNREKQSIRFNSIYKIQFLAHLIALTFYCIYCYLSGGETLKYFYLLYIFSSMLDISWFFIGIEDFKNVSIRNVIIKFASFILLFVLIKSEATL